jgi:hypothetical protein
MRMPELKKLLAEQMLAAALRSELLAKNVGRRDSDRRRMKVHEVISLRLRSYCECLLLHTISECRRWGPSGPNCLLPTQRSNQSLELERGTDFFAVVAEPRLKISTIFN